MSLDGISDGGRFAVLAIDHRDSLRAVLAPGEPDSVSADDITDLKRELVGTLAEGATGVMLEPEYSIPHLLKLPFPVDPAHEADRSVWAEACAGVTARCPMPWALLSGGGSYQSYRDQVATAVSEGCSGFMAGRALWGEAVLAPPADRARIIAAVVAPRLAELRSFL